MHLKFSQLIFKSKWKLIESSKSSIHLLHISYYYRWDWFQRSTTNENEFMIYHISKQNVSSSQSTYIFEKWDNLEYVIFDEVVQIFIQQSRETILMKKDLAKTFRHMSMIEIDWWLLSFFLRKWLLLWSLFTFRFTYLFLYFRSFNQSIALNIIDRFSLNYYIALFKRFLRYFALSSRFNIISKTYWWFVHKVWAQNQSQKEYMRYYNRLFKHRIWQWAHENSFTQKEIRTCYIWNQINFEAIFSFAYRITIINKLFFFRRQNDDIK